MKRAHVYERKRERERNKTKNRVPKEEKPCNQHSYQHCNHRADSIASNGFSKKKVRETGKSLLRDDAVNITSKLKENKWWVHWFSTKSSERTQMQHYWPYAKTSYVLQSRRWRLKCGQIMPIFKRGGGRAIKLQAIQLNVCSE